MAFEKFVPVKKSNAAQKPPEIKLLKGGQISLNASAYDSFLKGATHVELYYDPSGKKIGLKPKKYGTKVAFKLRAVGKGKSTYRVNAKQFIEHYKIHVGGKTAVKPAWNNSESLLELSL